ncbi:MAG: nucleoside triphosphate pyrophosphohydrolase [Gammaproteobacteria bacterium]|nr:nucleoside triphosphate pyrophosphohydrolase [Gammaproteobacteria bacterium]MDH4313722.1 nucleoside triphosphate pyrophosphohydrolase [Gammaproteobacteria bacterium]MDH5212966.1 nucleoside triphosphate pyrophosphohydrolase [Gammaproteobacteria bacterium]MDH5500820.1 nucleoside triphosphate pyrophosphohydrolase [Gammaproteobacteria bacterium]
MNDINKLLELIAALRHPRTGCPWDLQQDFASIAPYTVEEAYEVADAIARDDMPGLRDELGDLLFQVVFHARMAEESAAFDFAQVVEAIVDKMVRRHPHVFGSDEERRDGMQTGSWESIKAAERSAAGKAQSVSLLDGVAISLPALLRAQKLGERAGRAGFDWPDAAGAWEKITEEIEELQAVQGGGDKARVAEELGDLLFAVVNLARHLDVDAEQALDNASRKFERRFRSMEANIVSGGDSMQDLSLEQMERHWQQAKKAPGGNP